MKQKPNSLRPQKRGQTNTQLPHSSIPKRKKTNNNNNNETNFANQLRHASKEEAMAEL